MIRVGERGWRIRGRSEGLEGTSGRLANERRRVVVVERLGEVYLAESRLGNRRRSYGFGDLIGRG